MYGQPSPKPLSGWLVWATIVAALLLSLWLMQPPAAVSAQSPATAFSAERAFAHVNHLAAAPHPPGTSARDQARDYILAQFRALGYETRLQKTLTIRDYDYCFKVISVENIVACRPNASHTNRLLLLTAHYDSHITGAGAGDDASGVATLLEIARARKEEGSAAGTNDLAFVITDAEEQGLIGARGFIDDASTFWNGRFDPKRRDIIDLNFEARGGSGPVFMFETSNGNAGLIDALGSVPRPNATSLMYALYKTLPNDTDLTVFKQAGMRGLNFAFADRFVNYHTALDTPARLDTGSLQHHGSYGLALVDRLSGKWPALSSSDSIYFDLFGRLLIHYPVDWAWPLTVAALLLYIITLWRAWGMRRSFAGFLSGWGLFPVTLALGAAIALAIVRLMAGSRASTPYDDTYAARWFEGSLFTLVLVGTLLLWIPFLRRATPSILTMLTLGGLFWWLAALVAATLLLPGATYLFLWPLIATLIILLVSDRHPILSLLGALPTIFLFAPVWHGLALLLSFQMPIALGVLGAFAVAPLLPAIKTADGARLWPVGVLVLTGVGLFLAGTFLAHGPRIDSLIFAQDMDTQTAYWATQDPHIDDWQRQFVGISPEEKEGSYFYPWLKQRFRTAATAPLALPPVNVVRTGNTLTITAGDNLQEIIVSTDKPVRGLRYENHAIPVGNRPLCVRFLAPPTTGLSLYLDAEPGTVISCIACHFGLPPGTAPRPAQYTPAPIFPLTDLTLVKRTIHW